LARIIAEISIKKAEKAISIVVAGRISLMPNKQVT
jgi:hypothetical protein